MAVIEQRGDRFRLIFYHRNVRYSQRLTAEDRDEADRLKANAETCLNLINEGRIKVPPGTDLGVFVVTDGRLAQEPAQEVSIAIGKLYEEYTASIPPGSVEQSTLLTTRIHLNHLARLLGTKTQLAGLTNEKIQGYINQRLREDNGRGKLVSPVTVKKEVATLSWMWTWAMNRGKAHGIFPGRGVKYGKTAEQFRFQTYEEIERQIKRGGSDDLWDCLYLTVAEVNQLLKHASKNGKSPYLYPMLAMAAHTGARRSELLRCRVEDIDFEAKTITFRERKRDKDRHSLRTVPMSAFLAKTLKTWLTGHPGGEVFHFNNRPVRPIKAHKHLHATLKGSKWDKIKGWHVLRHSFASNCAAEGIDQRLIDEWLGHQTEQMSKRYRHLFPEKQLDALRKVFG
ncbi:site-specific integrase [bacterium]|nr:site-specific integrase [bacterium]